MQPASKSHHSQMKTSSCRTKDEILLHVNKTTFAQYLLISSGNIGIPYSLAPEVSPERRADRVPGKPGSENLAEMRFWVR